MTASSESSTKVTDTDTEFQKIKADWPSHFLSAERVSIQGIELQRSDNPKETLVKIGMLDQQNKWAGFHMDLPNSMYLLALLLEIQKRTGATLYSGTPEN